MLAMTSMKNVVIRNTGVDMRIEGLTEYQVDMLDHMWSLDTLEDYQEWYDLLDVEDQRMADSLQKLIILEAMEDVLGDMHEAKEVLAKF